MTDTVERVNLLEEALTKLAYAQFNLHIDIDRLILEGQASRARSEKEMAGFKAEMQASRDRSEKEMVDFKAEMAAFKDEMRADRREMNKRWGEIANRLGTIEIVNLAEVGQPRQG